MSAEKVEVAVEVHRHAVAHEFIDRCAKEGNLPALVEAFRTTIELFGFSGSAGGAWIGRGRAMVSRFYFIDWPDDWRDRYVREELFENDFVVIESGKRMTPFTWSEVVAGQDLEESHLRTYRAARQYGWVDGLAVSIHGPAGYQGLVSMASFSALTLSAEDRALLHAMAILVHDRCRVMTGFGTSTHPLPTLSAREIECMSWAASGCSDTEIGRRLGISGVTAHYHVENVKKKLGVNTRVQAVALLVLHGVI